MCVLLKRFINIKYVLCALLVGNLVSSCYKEPDSIIIDETTEQYQLYDYYVDDAGNEGVVALVSKNEYIVVISADEGFAYWGPMGEVVYNKDSIRQKELELIDFPLAMLQCMNARNVERFPAQYWCNKKNGDKFPYGGSWMLPSYSFLHGIFGYDGNNVSKLNNALLSIGGTPITDDYYWTCCEDVQNSYTIGGQSYDYDQANRAWAVTPYNKTWSNKNHLIKKLKYRVRAMKIIYYKTWY